MIRIEVLPASYGDCLLVTYEDGPARGRLLIDAGLTGTFEQVLWPRLREHGAVMPFDLIVVTHIDRDHIRGMLPLFRKGRKLIAPADVWFNGLSHLGDELGPAEGEALGRLLKSAGVPWNELFHGGPVVVPSTGDLPRLRLAGGATITLLSPYREHLQELRRVWDGDDLGSWAGDEADETAADRPSEPDDVLGIRPHLEGIDADMVLQLAEAPARTDKGAPNGSSIAFLFELGARRVLFAADAHAGVLERSLERLQPEGRVKLAAFKLAHHGSVANLSSGLLEKLDCRRFLVSTDGTIHGHPDPEAIARILTRPGAKQLCFNYRSDHTAVWEDAVVQKKFGCRVSFPKDPAAGYVLVLR